MKPDPVFEAIETVLGLEQSESPACPVVLLTPQGRVLSQDLAQEWSHHERIALICGRYEGVDERIRRLATDEVSIGDYVLTGGELPALIVIDAVTRLLPGALGDPDGAVDNSHAAGLLEYPHYTRPPEFRGERVPEVLLSGDHARIEKWRHEQSLLRTAERRPDLLRKRPAQPGRCDLRQRIGLHRTPLIAPYQNGPLFRQDRPNPRTREAHLPPARRKRTAAVIGFVSEKPSYCSAMAPPCCSPGAAPGLKIARGQMFGARAWSPTLARSPMGASTPRPGRHYRMRSPAGCSTGSIGLRRSIRGTGRQTLRC